MIVRMRERTSRYRRAHVLALLDEVLQVELGKAPPAQQVRLRLGPGVRSCSYSSLDLALA